MTSGTPTRMAAWLESAWLARYLDRQLDGEELAWFEGYLLDKPELLEAVEADNELRSAHFDAEDRSASRLHAHERPVAKHGFQAHAGSRVLKRGLALSASWVIGVGFGLFVHSFLASEDRIIANPSRMVIDTMRGETSAPRIYESIDGADYVLVDVAVPAGATHVNIHFKGGELPLKVGDDGFATFLISKKLAGSDTHVAYTVNGAIVTTEIPIRTDSEAQ